MIMEILWLIYSTLGVILILSSPIWMFLICLGLYNLAAAGWRCLTRVDEDDINVIEARSKKSRRMR